METIVYRLKSKPDKTVTVPADYAIKADGLVKIALSCPTILVQTISEHPYLSNIGILSRTRSLIDAGSDGPDSLKLQDEVYLRVCIYGNTEKMYGPDRESALTLDSSLIQAVESLSEE